MIRNNVNLFHMTINHGNMNNISGLLGAKKMFDVLFGNQNIEKIMFYLIIHNKCYARKLSTIFDSSVNGFQVSLKKLERAGIVANYMEGRTRVYVFNPRYPFLNELKQLFVKGYSYLPEDIKNKYYEQKERKRPRRTGKAL